MGPQARGLEARRCDPHAPAGFVAAAALLGATSPVHSSSVLGTLPALVASRGAAVSCCAVLGAVWSLHSSSVLGAVPALIAAECAFVRGGCARFPGAVPALVATPFGAISSLGALAVVRTVPALIAAAPVESAPGAALAIVHSAAFDRAGCAALLVAAAPPFVAAVPACVVAGVVSPSTLGAELRVAASAQQYTGGVPAVQPGFPGFRSLR